VNDAGQALDAKIHVYSLPPGLTTADASKKFMMETLGALTRSRDHLCLSAPSYSAFVQFDGFVAFCCLLLRRICTESDWRIIAHQCTEGREGASSEVLLFWLKGKGDGHAFLLRGRAPNSSHERSDGWVFMNQADIEGLLGYSLQPLFPLS
jgi:hypothetical protein